MSTGNDKPLYSPAHPSYRHPVYGNLPNPVTCINQISQTVHRPTGDFRRSSRDTAKAPGRTVAACCAFTFAVR